MRKKIVKDTSPPLVGACLLPGEAAGERTTEAIHQTLQNPTYEEVRALILEEQPTDL